jgi:hypothetical protein
LACEAALIPAASAPMTTIRSVMGSVHPLPGSHTVRRLHSFIVAAMKPVVHVPRYQVLAWILVRGTRSAGGVPPGTDQRAVHDDRHGVAAKQPSRTAAIAFLSWDN